LSGKGIKKKCKQKIPARSALVFSVGHVFPTAQMFRGFAAVRVKGSRIKITTPFFYYLCPDKKKQEPMKTNIYAIKAGVFNVKMTTKGRQSFTSIRTNQ
jgi:hypothetical protein